MKFHESQPATRKSAFSNLVLLLAVSAIATPALAQNPFPDAPGRDTVILVCSQCHSLSRLTQSRLTSSDWEFYVYDMISRGAPVHKKDIPVLRKYLIDNFATDK